MRAATAAPLLLLLLLGSCGGSGGGTATAESSGASSPLPEIVSRQKFIDETHVLCRKWKVNINRGLKQLYAKRAKETGEPEGQVGTVESMHKVIVPMYKRELAEFEKVGLPKGQAEEGEDVWESVRTIIHKIEDEGIFAWTRESLLFPYRKLAKTFQLQNCLYF
jgi:hypothetical protein